ncbi:MAG: carbohydrate ABC transporter permease [Defluviitaleaceae bacterium]|nr:carbohydrate ABC transporter permease [Defluviitaleaceae bacterium]
MFVPFYLMIVNSLKPIDEFFYWPPRLYVINPTTNSFRVVFRILDTWMVPFSRFIFNSVFVTTMGMVLGICIAALAAYPLAKAKVPGMKFITAVVVGTLLFSNSSTDFVRFIIMSQFGMIDTYWALIIPTLSGVVLVFLLRQFIEATIPDEILEAARIDGGSEFAILFQIVIPMIKPAVMTAVVVTFPVLWSTHGSGVYSENLRTLPSVLAQIGLGGTAMQGPAAAVGVIIMVPSLFIFLYSQRSLMQTMSYSGIK